MNLFSKQFFLVLQPPSKKKRKKINESVWILFSIPLVIFLFFFLPIHHNWPSPSPTS